MIKIISLVIAVISFDTCFSQTALPYQDSHIGIEKRVEDLLSRMTLEEKFWQMFMIPFENGENIEKYKNGIFGLQFSDEKSPNAAEKSPKEISLNQAKRINSIQEFFINKTRLGIPIIPFDEALHGLVRSGAIAYPQSIGLAATFDTALVSEVAMSIASGVRERGIRQVLSPVINIASDVRWGRTEETYGEDPFLSSRMGCAFISSFERSGIIATPKHFAVNSGDGGRDSYPIFYNERILDEVYLPPFEVAVKEAHATSIMSSYNSYDGTPCTANNWLLNEKLKKEWGFTGFVISDAGATGGANVLHFTSPDYAQSTKLAIENGLDVILQTSFDHYKLFYEAFEKGMISKESIDNSVRRVLRAKFRLGLFDHPYVDIESKEKENSDLALKAARESIVLLKNEREILPLKKDIGTVAVIGIDATEGRLGGYSRPGKARVNILEGIQNKIGQVRVHYAPGCGRDSDEFSVVPSSCLSYNKGGKQEEGLNGEYFNNIELYGKPELIRTDKQVNFRWTLFSPEQGKINYDYFSARWTGELTAPLEGKARIGLKGDDGYKLFLNDSLIIDNWRKQTVREITTNYYFEKGRKYRIRIEFYETSGSVHLDLIWNLGDKKEWKEKIAEAVELARKSNVTIVVAGIEEGEFRDRSHLSLPGRQEKMIKEIAATGKPVVVVLSGGSAITLNGFYDNVSSVIDAWYPGDEGGNAVADVLFGDYNPSGRLPIGFPADVSQLPYTYYHKPTGRGDDYLDLTGKPFFPFGFGLSYTSFEYSNIRLTKTEIRDKDSTTLFFILKNTGKYEGDEVVQLYIKDLIASVARPMLELKGFQRVHLKPGETKEVRFSICPAMLEMYDKDLRKIIEPGEFSISVGASSNDLRSKVLLKYLP